MACGSADPDVNDVRAAWNFICRTRIFNILSDDANYRLHKQYLQVLLQNNQQHAVSYFLIERCRKMIKHNIKVEFWDIFRQHFPTEADDHGAFKCIQASLAYVSSASTIMKSSLHDVDQILQTNLLDQYTKMLNVVIFDQHRPNDATMASAHFKFNQILKQAFTYLYHYHMESGSSRDPDASDNLEKDLDDQEDNCIHEFATCLTQLQWGEIVQQPLIDAIYDQIDTKINTSCQDTFDVSILGDLVEWMETSIYPFLSALLIQHQEHHSTGPKQELKHWKMRTSFYLHNKFTRFRVAELFDMIKDYPSSEPAIADLKASLEKTLKHQELLQSFKHALDHRLLHPGVATDQIIDFYILIIKAFHQLDPSGVLLESINKLIKPYLRTNRQDTVRCIITSLTDDQTSDLFQELGHSNQTIEPDDLSDDEQANEPGGRPWEPDPIHSDPTQTSKTRLSKDLLRMLVTIYDSKQIFVNEYRSQLAKKLILNVDFNTDQEICTLELLKLRFGDKCLQECEIMIKDVDESKRINNNITSSRPSRSKSPVHTTATIVSEHFWPPFHGDEFKMHSAVESVLEEYKKSYTVLKNPRTLEWVPYLGVVQLSLDFDGVQKPFEVPPIYATIILHFQDKERWVVTDLANELEMDSISLKSKLAYWVNHGILHFSPCQSECFVVSNQTPNDENQQYGAQMDDPVGCYSSTESHNKQQQHEFEVYESYIYGMLSNFGTLELHRIHSMLSTFARSSSTPYDKTIAELSKFMATLVQKQKVEFSGGQYQLYTT